MGELQGSGKLTQLSSFPLQCSVGPSSDKALTFMKDHFLMDEQVVAKPLLVKSGVEYTRLAVETVQGLNGYTHLIMYLGTSEYRVSRNPPPPPQRMRAGAATPVEE